MYFILMCTQSCTVPDSEHLGRVGYKRSNGSIRIKTPFYLEASRQPGREKLTGGVLTLPFLLPHFLLLSQEDPQHLEMRQHIP